MTTLQSWVSYSDTGERSDLPRAVYIVSDSRITWGSFERRWEAGRKIFTPNLEPHLFGYCGDVIFPALLIGQLTSAIDAGILFSSDASADERNELVLQAVRLGVSRAVSTPTGDFSIHHLYRERSWPNTHFRAWTIFFKATSGTCSSQEVCIPSTTAVIGSFGSGRESARAHHSHWQATESAGRSRAILSSFCDSISSDDDPLSGGPPQLAALYTKGPPIQIGMYINRRKFVNGLEVTGSSLGKIEWRDRLGQEVEPQTGKVIPGARRFFRPTRESGS